MEKRLIKKAALPSLIGKLSATSRVYGPVKEGDYVLFRALQKDEEPLVDYANSRNAPKQFFFPPPGRVAEIYPQRFKEAGTADHRRGKRTRRRDQKFPVGKNHTGNFPLSIPTCPSPGNHHHFISCIPALIYKSPTTNHGSSPTAITIRVINSR